MVDTEKLLHLDNFIAECETVLVTIDSRLDLTFAEKEAKKEEFRYYRLKALEKYREIHSSFLRKVS